MAIAPVKQLFPQRQHCDPQRSTGAQGFYSDRTSERIRMAHLFMGVLKCFVPRIKI